MDSFSRNTSWKDIWIKKGLDKNTPLHVADGYDLLTSEEFDAMVEQVAKPLHLIGNENILECGCGAGAFLASLLKIYPKLTVSGIDYSPSLIARAREQINGNFILGDITNLDFLPQNYYDCLFSFGVIFYLSSEEHVKLALEGMLRSTKPGGKVLIGEVPDASKKELAEKIRQTSHQAVKKLSTVNLDHLYLSKQFFLDFARNHAIEIHIIDHTSFELGNYQAANYRYSVYMIKKG